MAGKQVAGKAARVSREILRTSGEPGESAEEEWHAPYDYCCGCRLESCRSYEVAILYCMNPSWAVTDMCNHRALRKFSGKDSLVAKLVSCDLTCSTVFFFVLT